MRFAPTNSKFISKNKDFNHEDFGSIDVPCKQE